MLSPTFVSVVIHTPIVIAAIRNAIPRPHFVRRSLGPIGSCAAAIVPLTGVVSRRACESAPWSWRAGTTAVVLLPLPRTESVRSRLNIEPLTVVSRDDRMCGFSEVRSLTHWLGSVHMTTGSPAGVASLLRRFQMPGYVEIHSMICKWMLDLYSKICRILTGGSQ